MTLLKRLGLRLPIVQAPMAGVSTPAMAAAVSDAGGLGSIAVGAATPAGAKAMIRGVQQRTSAPFNVNVFCHEPPRRDLSRERGWLAALEPYFASFNAEPPRDLSEIYPSFIADPAMLDVLVTLQPAVVSFHFGLPPQSAIDQLKAAGIALFATATNLSEAQTAVFAGVDAVVAQGHEAGGHRGLFQPQDADPALGTFALTRLLATRLDCPVIAAGGIMDGEAIAAALQLGAAAVQMGTAFIACPESAADGDFQSALFGPGAFATEVTSVVSGRPGRMLPNGFTRLKRTLPAVQPGYPLAYGAAKALAAAARTAGDGSFGAHWAGQGAPLARTMPASELMRTLADELTIAQARTSLDAAATSRF